MQVPLHALAARASHAEGPCVGSEVTYHTSSGQPYLISSSFSYLSFPMYISQSLEPSWCRVGEKYTTMLLAQSTKRHNGLDDVNREA
jgi:hypothetical protein